MLEKLEHSACGCQVHEDEDCVHFVMAQARIGGGSGPDSVSDSVTALALVAVQCCVLKLLAAAITYCIFSGTVQDTEVCKLILAEQLHSVGHYSSHLRYQPVHDARAPCCDKG